MAELLPCPFCNNKKISVVVDNAEYSFGLVDETDVHFKVICSTTSCGCGASSGWCNTEQEAVESWNTRTPKERGADKPKVTCLNCKHLMFSDMYGECNKQLRIVNPSDTCEYAEPKERGGEK